MLEAGQKSPLSLKHARLDAKASIVPNLECNNASQLRVCRLEYNRRMTEP